MTESRWFLSSLPQKQKLRQAFRKGLEEASVMERGVKQGRYKSQYRGVAGPITSVGH